MSITKVINLDDFRKKPKRGVGQMNYDATYEVKDRFDMATYVVDYLFGEAEDSIKEAGLNPTKFSLIPEYAQKCLATDLDRFFNGDEEAMVLAYQAVIDAQRYVVVVEAMVEEDIFEIESTVVKWDGKTWLAYNFTNGLWEEGPGSDFV